MTRYKILVQGVGGIGGVMAARLIRAGHETTLVTSNPAITQAINEEGLRVKTLKEEFTQRVKAFTTLDELPADSRHDFSLLIMKANSVVDVARATVPFLEPGKGYLVTCQNGIVEDAVAAAVGADKVVSAIIGWGGTMHSPGVYEKTGPGAIHIGELDGRVTDRVKLLAGVLKSVTPVVVSENMRGALWSKLSINCIITTIGALTGEVLGQMLKDRTIRRVFLEVYREVVDTAEARGVKLVRIAAHPKLLYLKANAGWLSKLIKDLLMRVVGLRYGKLRSSMLQSLERGRKTEIDFLNGYVVAQAKEAGVDVPFNQALVRIVKEIEDGKRGIEKANMDELAGLLV
jgi:2-dehydropantoate 2-reductase